MEEYTKEQIDQLESELLYMILTNEELETLRHSFIMNES